MKQLPLFPLGAVLFPGGSMPLRIFEPRYVDLVRDCLKHDAEFGVVWIREGREVVAAPESAMPKLAQLGTTARIVDWDAQPDGTLGIVIEGGQKFRLLSTAQQPNFLVIGDIELLPQETAVVLPERAADLIQLLRQLTRHPSIARLNLAIDELDGGRLAHLVAQLLPIAEANKFNLLAETDPLQRLDRLLELLDQFDQ